jgi:signal peptidase I
MNNHRLLAVQGIYHPSPKSYVNISLNLWRRAAQSHWLSIQGSSMWPLLRPGDQVLVDCTPIDIRIGDIVVFQSQPREGDAQFISCRSFLIVHRVIRRMDSAKGSMYITMGDNMSCCDTPVSMAQIIGRVVCIRRGKRQFVLDTPIWQTAGKLIAAVSRATLLAQVKRK